VTVITLYLLWIALVGPITSSHYALIHVIDASSLQARVEADRVQAEARRKKQQELEQHNKDFAENAEQQRIKDGTLPATLRFRSMCVYVCMYACVCVRVYVCVHHHAGTQRVHAALMQQRLRLNKPERSGSVKRPYCDSSRRSSSVRWDLETIQCITISGV